MQKIAALLACAVLFLSGTTSLRAEDVVARETQSPGVSMRPAYDDPSRGDYVLGTGDKVHITVYNEDDLGGTFQIDAKGFVQLPLVGAVAAAGGTADDLATRYGSALSDGYVLSPRISIEVAQYRPFYIVGEVAKPGQYDYVNDIGVPNAIALAGGYTVKAINSWIYIRHLGEKTERRVPADETTRIEPGDVLRVPSTTFWDVMDVLSPITSTAASYAPRP